MANWETLSRLRLHRTILTIAIVAQLGYLLYSYNDVNNVNNVSLSNSPKVVAKSGLKIRKYPNLNAAVLITVPFNESLIIVEKEGNNDIINGKSGSWYQVEYNGTNGYAWSQFVRE